MSNTIKRNESLICESCGKEFFCGAKNGSCWCFDIRIEREVLADIQKKYKNCLCSDCLKNKTELLLAK